MSETESVIIIIINTTDEQKDGPTPHHELNVEFKCVSMFRAFNRHLSISLSSHTHSSNSATTFHASPPLSCSPSVSFLFSPPPSLLPPRRWSSSLYSCPPPCGRSSPLVTSQQRGLRRGQYAAGCHSHFHVGVGIFLCSSVYYYIITTIIIYYYLSAGTGS